MNLGSGLLGLPPLFLPNPHNTQHNTPHVSLSPPFQQPPQTLLDRVRPLVPRVTQTSSTERREDRERSPCNHTTQKSSCDAARNLRPTSRLDIREALRGCWPACCQSVGSSLGIPGTQSQFAFLQILQCKFFNEQFFSCLSSLGCLGGIRRHVPAFLRTRNGCEPIYQKMRRSVRCLCGARRQELMISGRRMEGGTLRSDMIDEDGGMNRGGQTHDNNDNVY